ncbi:MAG: hypothetical protein JWM10_2665 [Myxococcaceae bacterium]|nr:hypothetical protein [Myxococcaceae bacterium]
MRHVTALALLLSSPLAGCAPAGADDPDGADSLEAAITSAGAWYHLDHSDGVANPTLTVANGYRVTCPDGRSSTTCRAARLVLPADCGWECRDGLLSGRGEAMLRGRFERGAFVVTAGLDTWQAGLGAESIYRITGAAACAHDPCPSGLSAQKLNTTRAPTAVTAVDFSHAADPNYVLDPTRGDDQAASEVGLLASGHVVAHVFRADRVWRPWTPRPACDPQLTARDHAGRGGAEIAQLRTVAEAERRVVPEGTSAWLVRTAQTPAAVEFTAGVNDLWAERFSIDRRTCALTVLAEH